MGRPAASTVGRACDNGQYGIVLHGRTLDAADCCVGFPDSTPGTEGDVVCVYWSRIGRNECWFPDTFSRAGITPP